MRLIITYGLKPALFVSDEPQPKNDITSILNLDVLTISQEVDNIRNDRRSKKQYSAQDKLLIHLCYLLSTRFEDQYELVIKLIHTFVEKAGRALPSDQIADLLRLVSELKIGGRTYLVWNECIGAFMQAMGCEKFFEILPLELLNHDMQSLTYGQQSRSYLLPIMQKYLKKGDLAFYWKHFSPLIQALDSQREKCVNPKSNSFSLVKAKKLEALIYQIWDTCGIFCRSNSTQLSSSFQAMQTYLSQMIETNPLNTRCIALRIFSTMIDHCRNTPKVDDEIRKTRALL